MRESPLEGHSVPPLSVLVVDDNADAADSQALLLRLWGHAVRVVYDGPAAVQAFLVSPPDVVLLDLGLPGVDGYEVASRLQALSPGESFMLIALTGHGREADRRRAEEAGFDLHLVKPVEPDHLRQILDRWADRKAGRLPPRLT